MVVCVEQWADRSVSVMCDVLCDCVCCSSSVTPFCSVNIVGGSQQGGKVAHNPMATAG
jgi:hypothetical protein